MLLTKKQRKKERKKERKKSLENNTRPYWGRAGYCFRVISFPTGGGVKIRICTNMVVHLNGYLINFIENVDARNINAISFDDVNQFLGGGIMSQGHISVADSVLAKYGFHSVNVQLRL